MVQKGDFGCDVENEVEDGTGGVSSLVMEFSRQKRELPRVWSPSPWN
jgi:hypothetical protein